MLARAEMSCRCSLIPDELNPECSELFQREQEMLGAASESIEAPYKHAIKPALAGIIHQSIQCRATLARAGVSVIDILGYFLR